MDIQLTDFENAAMIVLLGMIVNLSNHYDVDFIMPISKIDDNMDRAHSRDGVINQKFWFKTNILHNKESYRDSKLQESDYLLSHSH